MLASFEQGSDYHVAAIFRLWTNMTDKEFKILESTLCADIAETESQVRVHMVALRQ